MWSWELDQVCQQALDQLADAVQEYKEAKRLKAANRPSEELAIKRMALARDAVRLCLRTYEQVRDLIYRNYRSANPV
jgi:hypothetical protein